MRTRYIPDTLSPDGNYSLAAAVVADPIFTPLFLSLGFTGTIGATGIATAGVMSAIATTALTYGVLIQ